LELHNTKVRDAFTSILAQAGLLGDTNGFDLFVLQPPVDTVTPEQTAAEMPLNAKNAIDSHVAAWLKEADSCYFADRYEDALPYMQQALSACYEVHGQEDTVYQLVNRFHQIYSSKRLAPAEAVRTFGQDSYLSRYLVRFYKRSALESGNFDDYLECIRLLNQLPAAHNPKGQIVGDAEISDQLSWLESSIYSQIFPSDSIDQRLGRLEQTLLGKTCPGIQTSKRMMSLVRAMQPQNGTSNSVAQGQQKSNWFLNPPPVPWLNSIGRGFGTAGKAIISVPATAATGAHSALRSPLFWDTVLLGGAATGAYFALHNSNFSSSRNSIASGERGCSGSPNCHYCTNCNSCPNCAGFSSTKCNVWYSARGWIP
jgi:hypothetical protein